MSGFFSNLLTASFHGSIVILAVIILRLVLRKTPKKYICLLWLLAGLRLLMPIEIHSNLSLQPDIALPFSAIACLKWSAALPLIWGVIALSFAVYSLISYMKLKKQVREAVKIRGGWESDQIETAFILGFIKPQIYIPMGMNRQSRRHILEHERAHLDKGDHWIKMIGFIALALHWFNPLVWIAYIMLCKDIEIACDERVVQFMELDERKSYSAALLSCSSKTMHFAASPVAFGEVSVRQRIRSVLNYKKPSFWLSLLGVAALFFVAICLLTSPTESAETVDAALSPEEQAQLDMMQQCHNDLQAAFAQEEFCYDVYGTNSQGNTLWLTQLYKSGSSTAWTYNADANTGNIRGRMEYQGEHYVMLNGSWMKAEDADTEFDEWLDLFRWDPQTARFVEQKQDEYMRTIIFTTTWEDDLNAIHTSTVTCRYDSDGTLSRVWVEHPDDEYTAMVHIFLDRADHYNEPKHAADFFEDAQANIAEGFVTSQELAEQAEYDEWKLFFRIDDDRLTSKGADVIFSQDESGRGALTTTEEYWLEIKVNGKWEAVPRICDPSWSEDRIGVPKGTSSYGYLDWTPVYGTLEAGEYRMGKTFTCSDQQSGYYRSHDFYLEFKIRQIVDSDSPEAVAAVERCYEAMEELKARSYIHYKISSSSWLEETWINGGNYLLIRDFGDNPEGDAANKGRVDIIVRRDGVGYQQVRDDPQVRGSKVIGMELTTMSPYSAGWNISFEESLFIPFFERSNKTATFPEDMGVISDEMVRFQLTWPVVGLSYREASAQLTYKFDEEGNLTYMEYRSKLDGSTEEYVLWVEIYDTTPEDIDAKIKSYTEDLIVGTFSWEDAKAKYTQDEFNIREDHFVNVEPCPITGPLDATILALKEYPNLGAYLSIDVSRDEDAGMWKVTITSYVDYQSTYAYRDIYLTDDGITCLLVYEGPVSFFESRR